jgi:hypothetical protein
LLKGTIPGNPNITSIEEIDHIYLKIKSAKIASNLHHTYPPRNSNFPDLDYENKKKSKRNMHIFNTAADHRQSDFLKNYADFLENYAS